LRETDLEEEENPDYVCGEYCRKLDP